MSVERIRTALVAGGLPTRKDEVVSALQALQASAGAEIGIDRRWRLRGNCAAARRCTGTIPDATYALRAIPATVIETPPEKAEEPLPDGRLTPDAALLGRLLPYYRDSLRSGDGGSVTEALPKYGSTFILLRPTGSWWATATRGRILRLRRADLPDDFLVSVAKHAGAKLQLGYPLQLVSPKDQDDSSFLRPITTTRVAFQLTETALEIRLPCVRPTLNPDWLTGKARYGNWNADRLRSWLLAEDDQAETRADDDVGIPEFVDMATLANRLDAAVKPELMGPLDPGTPAATIPARPATGIYNAISLSLDLGGKYTRSAVADYDRLLDLAPEALARTGLGALFEVPSAEGAPPPPVLHPFPLSESQLAATRAGLQGPLTVITGPPGTGKSQVIAALMISAAAAGKSVLFAARQHRALDAVQERLEGATGERAFLVRANDSEGTSSFSFGPAIQALLTRPDRPEAAQLFEQGHRSVEGLDRERWRLLDAWRDLARLTALAAAARADVEAVQVELERHCDAVRHKGLEKALDAPAVGWIRRLLARLRERIFGVIPAIGSVRALHETERRLKEAMAELARAETAIPPARSALAGTESRPVDLTADIAQRTVALLPLLLDVLETVDRSTRTRLTEIAGELGLQGRGSRNALPEEAARTILRHMPLWAVTTLAAGSRIPLIPALFDYVVFDEAAQTDIASAIPLMYRGANVIVVGDPQQLAMISNLEPREERELLRTHDLMRPGIGRFAQGRTTLFDLAASSGSARRFMLTEHYRCHHEIAGFINEAFYGRRLEPLTDETRLKIPQGMKAGLHWTNVVGPVRARTGGGSRSAGCEAEADAIAAEVARLIGSDFAGTIGVVTFFDYQAQLIHDLVRRRCPAEARDRHAVKVFTANKFQGDERDVILLSLCLGPDMPPGGRNFIAQEKRLLNVAVSRARAVCHVFGNEAYASRSGIPHIEALARRVCRARDREPVGTDDRFDSIWERRLYEALRARGLEPIPQYPVGGRFLDLALVNDTTDPPRRIDVEVDGVTYHRDADGDRLSTDLWRDRQLTGLGWKVLRFWVYELRDDMESCVERIVAEFRA